MVILTRRLMKRRRITELWPCPVLEDGEESVQRMKEGLGAEKLLLVGEAVPDCSEGSGLKDTVKVDQGTG